jgi:hypothetical protein
MSRKQQLFLRGLAVLAVLIVAPAPVLAAKAKAPVANPDFTRGGVIPADASHDWNLGATGVHG